MKVMHHICVCCSEFETELRSNTGPDPLDVWHRYAQWVEQSYPKGGKNRDLKPLLEKCFSAMTGTEELIIQYKNDPRFLQLWLKYVSIPSMELTQVTYFL